LNERITDICLVDSLLEPKPARVAIGDSVRQLIERSAELICYSYGSFYTSLVANLLPAGVGRAVARAECLKVYIPNLGADPEQVGMSLWDSVSTLLAYLKKDAGADVPVQRLLDMVIVDPRWLEANADDSLQKIREHGVQTVLLDFADRDLPRADPERLAEALISLV